MNLTTSAEIVIHNRPFVYVPTKDLRVMENMFKANIVFLQENGDGTLMCRVREEIQRSSLMSATLELINRN